MTDPWCWYIYADIWGILMVKYGKCYHIYQHHGSVMGSGMTHGATAKTWDFIDFLGMVTICDETAGLVSQFD
jgi:hypothetical protein